MEEDRLQGEQDKAKNREKEMQRKVCLTVRLSLSCSEGGGPGNQYKYTTRDTAISTIIAA